MDRDQHEDQTRTPHAGDEGESEESAAPRMDSEVGGPRMAADFESDEEGDPANRLQEELEEARDRHLRLAAEFENYRKRTRQELGQSGTRAQAALLGSLLDVLDDIDRFAALDPTSATAESVIEGIDMVRRKVDRILGEAGVELVMAQDAPFDPETMEAVVRVPTSDPEEDDRVAQVLQKGVILKGHLVRPARVAVKKAD